MFFHAKNKVRKQILEPVPRDELRIRVVESLAEWESLAGDWNELLKSSRADTIFLTWEWLFSWAECFLTEHRRLFIVTVYRDHELIGIAPWYCCRLSRYWTAFDQVKFLGEPEMSSDYLDVIIRRGAEEQVSHALYDFLFMKGRQHWDCLSLGDLPADSLFLLYFQDRLDRDGKYGEIRRGSYCPRVTIPRGDDWVPDGVSAKRRTRFRQDLAKLGRSGEFSHRTVCGDAVRKGVEEFFSFYSMKSGHEYLSLQVFMERFSARSAGRDMLQIDFLNVKGKTIAAMLDLLYRDEVLLYAMAVDKEFNPKISPGNLLIGLCLKQAWEEKKLGYDFLKGHEPYKFYWADSGRTTLGLYTAQTRLKPILLTTAQVLKNTARLLLR